MYCEKPGRQVVPIYAGFAGGPAGMVTPKNPLQPRGSASPPFGGFALSSVTRHQAAPVRAYNSRSEMCAMDVDMDVMLLCCRGLQ